MKIDNEYLKLWSVLYEHGDYSKISKQSKVGVLSIQNAFKYKRASSKTILAIKEYFDKKQIVINSLKQKPDETISN